MATSGAYFSYSALKAARKESGCFNWSDTRGVREGGCVVRSFFFAKGCKQNLLKQ